MGAADIMVRERFAGLPQMKRLIWTGGQKDCLGMPFNIATEMVLISMGFS